MKRKYQVEELLIKHKEIELCLANKKQLCFNHYTEFIKHCDFIEKKYIINNLKLIEDKTQIIEAYIAILKDKISIIDYLYQLLEPEELQIIRGFYYSNHTMNFICQSIPISTATFSRIKNKALHKMELHYLAITKGDKNLINCRHK